MVMKKIKKAISICFVLFLLVSATVAGTLAYENVSPAEWATQTDRTISVKLVQEQRAYDSNGIVCGLVPFEDEKVLVPLVGSAQYDGHNFDKYGLPMADGYVDQIVRVRNDGDASAYVRVSVAIPSALDDSNTAGNNALHWNLGNRFMENGSFSKDNQYNTAFQQISWEFVGQANINDIEHNVYTFTYKDILGGKQTTNAAAFVGFYLDRDVEIVNGHIILDDVDTGFTNDSVKIHVKAQAVQSYGFENAAEAFKTSGLSNNPWK